MHLVHRIDQEGPFQIYGKTYARWFRMPELEAYECTFKIVSVNADVLQGFALFVDGFEGELCVNGVSKSFNKKNTKKFLNFIFSEQDFLEASDQTITIRVKKTSGHLTLANSAKLLGDYFRTACMGVAFAWETLGDGTIRFYCNNVVEKETFDNFVFDMTIREIAD